MKKLLMLFVFMCTITMWAQPGGVQAKAPENDYNLPPGAKLRPKFAFIDLSFKIENKAVNVHYTQDQLTVMTDYSPQEMDMIKTEEPKEYEYYQKWNIYLDSISEKVREIYNIRELQYIYVFDQSLKEKLLTVK